MGLDFWVWVVFVGLAATSFFLQRKLLGLPPVAFEGAFIGLLLFRTGWEHFTPMLYILGLGFVVAIAVDPFIWSRAGACRLDKSAWVHAMKLNAKLCGGGFGAFLFGMFCRKLLAP